MEGKVCTKCGVWKALEEYNKHKLSKDGKRSMCRECQKEYKKQWNKNNKEYYKEYNKEYYQNNKEYFKEHNKQWREDNKEYIKEYEKQYRENNKERRKECNKQHYQNNKEYYKERNKQWRENNTGYHKQYYQNNKERYKKHCKQWKRNNKEYCEEYRKQYYQTIKENNLQYISGVVEQINPTFEHLNLSVYGYVYMFENIKTGHVYIGQTIRPLKERYNGSNIIQRWIKERLDKSNQKFTEELIEEDFVLTEVLDVAFCQYHLNVLEAYYINKYDSCENGYNNTIGNHKTDDGLEEFMEILQQHNLEFVDGQIIKKAN